MKKNKKIVTCFSVFMLCITLNGCAKETTQPSEEVTQESKAEDVLLNVWYTESELEAYLKEASASYENEMGIKVVLSQVSSEDYLEQINEKNIQGTEIVDLYVLNSEWLEQAYMAGLTSEIPALEEESEGLEESEKSMKEEVSTEENSTAEEDSTAVENNTSSENDIVASTISTDVSSIETRSLQPQVAIDASSFKGKQVGYPFYYQTSFLLYNKRFITEPPQSMQAIMDFATEYGVSTEPFEGIEMLIKWDAESIFYNYGFLGAYLNLGGSQKDDKTIIDVNNSQVIESLSFYKMMNQSMYFDMVGNTYDSILEEFLQGKILYTIAGTQSLRRLEEAELSYGIAPMPRLNDTLNSQVVSINRIITVNPYTQNTEAANDLALYLSDTYADRLYELSGYFPTRGLAASAYPREEFAVVQDAYEGSVLPPKIMDISNYWVLLETAISNIWFSEVPEENIGDLPPEEALQEGEWADAARKEATLESIRNIVREQMNQVQAQLEAQLK